ncbi:putative HTH-type transcriptional regulator YjiR [Roseovarius sp. A-2]|uniref:MocR-like pyridoxine biosynthesis transcription factor PdxR n=1 Tax=Roseovarius sp. A-2 TaxID=1570360 RepID=UPI0009B57177|nr:PLP-dependent aminotransferase family protein [Roseovarius sp. A-2]GAW36903.1 putative HTH-type transcriptional regulator YjiR [Roseovarius sp. A-2]
MLKAHFLTLPEDSTLCLRDQVCELVSSAIARDLFPRGAPLPSCRDLSAHLGVSRNTVHDAYCRLIDIGLVTSKDRSGYFVDEAVADRERAAIASKDEKTSGPSPLEKMMSHVQRPSQMAKVDHPKDLSSYPYPFVYNQIDPKWFPIQEWRESMRAAMAASALASWSRDAGEADSPNLIKQLQQRLLGYRGISAEPDEILVTSGAQNAISLLAMLNAYVGRSVAIEDPCYPEARNAFEVAGNRLCAVPVDQCGLIVDRIPAGVGLVYTTPSHQFPTTVTMPRQRRLALCARAARDDFLICEDDYEAELNFVKTRERPIRSLDPSGRTIYVGSLSKSVAPGLRIGYMVAHPDIVREAKAIRRSNMRHPPILLQDSMAHFIASGALDAHLRRMERRYKSRWEIMLSALTEYMPDFDLQVSRGGTCVWLTGPADLDTTDLARRLKHRGVLVDEGSVFYRDPSEGSRKLRLGFAALSRAAILDGIKIIAQEVRQATE